MFPAEVCQRRNSFSKSFKAYLLHKTEERSMSCGERINNFLSNDCVVILELAECNYYLEVCCFFIKRNIDIMKRVQVPLLDFAIGKSEYLDIVADLNPKFGFPDN